MRAFLRRFSGALLLATLLVLTLARVASAQRPPPAPATERPSDDDAPDSPRASMRSFLDLCERGRTEEAARYLDVPRGAEKRAGELARKLHVVLAERLWIDAEKLSRDPQGKRDDALPPGTDEIGRLDDGKGHSISIRLVRHDPRSPEDEPRWVFSQSTVQSVDGLYASLKGGWVRDHLPAPLVAPGPLSLYYWQWVALPLLAVACVALGRILTSISGAIARRFTAKRPWGARLIHRVRRPVTMAWALLLFWLLLPYVGLTLRAEDLVERLLRALGWLAFFWALFRSVTIAGDEVSSAAWARAQPNIRAVTGVGVRLGKVVVFALALMVALSELGYPVTTVVAGLGIGGVALALAAQKTVENLFGSISILADQPFRVGDTIRVDGIEGAVETIGLRSTRMRTVERTLVIIPNGKLADMRIESLGPRDRIRFSTKLSVARHTPARKLEEVIAAVRAKLSSHDAVVKDDVFVRLAALGESSYDIEIAAPIETTDGAEFAKVREELLLACVAVVTDLGVELADPARHVALTGARAREAS